MTNQPDRPLDGPHEAQRRPGWLAPAAIAAVCLLVAGFLLLRSGGDDPVTTTTAGPAAEPAPATPTTTEPPTSTAPTPSSSTTTTTNVASYPTGVRPARVIIPAIDVDATSVDLDLNGPTPEVPDDFGQVGWYEQTRLPGEIGPAVIAGHVDSTTGPAVFYRLDDLAAGDEIAVVDDAGGQRSFRVTGSAQYPKDALPPEVFGFGEGVPELRLITCGGSFDRSSGHYRDNLVVYATAA